MESLSRISDAFAVFNGRTLMRFHAFPISLIIRVSVVQSHSWQVVLVVCSYLHYAMPRMLHVEGLINARVCFFGMQYGIASPKKIEKQHPTKMVINYDKVLFYMLFGGLQLAVLWRCLNDAIARPCVGLRIVTCSLGCWGESACGWESRALHAGTWDLSYITSSRRGNNSYDLDVEVSWNRGTRKSSILIGLSMK